MARAQHMVTDVEAGKLTLDALTATPRAIYRQIVAVRRVRHGSYIGRPFHARQAVYRRRVGRRGRH